MPHHVRMQAHDPDRIPSPLDHLIDHARRHWAFALLAEPQRRRLAVATGHHQLETLIMPMDHARPGVSYRNLATPGAAVINTYAAIFHVWSNIAEQNHSRMA